MEKFSLTSHSHFRTKWSKVLLAWLLMMVIYIFPEAGLVLFMSIYHWVRLIYYHTSHFHYITTAGSYFIIYF